MTGLVRGRVVRASDVPSPARDAELPLLTPSHHRRIAREEVLARETAAALLADARAQAAAIVDEARRAAEGVARAAAEEARQREESKLAGLYLRLKQEDETRATRDLDRAVGLGVVLAERVLGVALASDPTLVVKLAEQALAEARGARRATIDASPLDGDALRHHLAETGFDSHTVDIRTDPALERGSLRISTNLGTLDAQLHPQLERLAKALRDTLQRG